MDDKAIILGLKNNDNTAFKQVFHLYGSFVYDICYNFVRNKVEAEDLTQEVFLRIFQTIPKFRGECTLKTWIFSITRNTCLNFFKANAIILKRYQFESLSDKNDIDQDYGFRSMDDPEQQLINFEREVILQNAMNLLPINQSIAIKLLVYSHLSYREIAETMNTSIKSVESLLQRAKNNLIKIIQKKI